MHAADCMVSSSVWYRLCWLQRGSAGSQWFHAGLRWPCGGGGEAPLVPSSRAGWFQLCGSPWLFLSCLRRWDGSSAVTWGSVVLRRGKGARAGPGSLPPPPGRRVGTKRGLPALVLPLNMLNREKHYWLRNPSINSASTNYKATWKCSVLTVGVKAGKQSRNLLCCVV